MGIGPEEDNLKQLSQSIGLDVDWVGFCKKPEEWMNRSKVCLIPSRWEGFGLVAAEAMACGCQVLHSGVDSLDSVCGEHAITFDSDTSKWPQQMIDMLNNYQVNLQGQKWISNNYNKIDMIKNYERLYRSCVASAD